MSEHGQNANCVENESAHSEVLVLAFALGDGVGADLLVVLLEGGEVFSGLGELAFFHALGDVPVDEGALGEHEVEVLVGAGPDLGDGGGVGDHEQGALDLGEVAAWDDGWWLVVDADLEAGRAPVDELDGPLGLDDGDGGVDVLRDDVTAVHHAAGHVLAVAWVALDHHVGRLEDGVGDLGDGELLVVRLVGGDERGIGAEREVDTRIRDQVGLELCQVDVQSPVEAEGGGHPGDHLGDDSVDVGVGAALDVEVAVADIIHSLVVDHEGAVGVLKHAVGSVNGVVGLDDGDGDVDGWVDDELQLGLSAVVDGQTLEQEGAETGTGTATEGVEHQEALEAGTVVGQLSDAVKDQVNNLLADGVVATGVVVRSVLLAGDQLLWVVDLAVGASASSGTWECRKQYLHVSLHLSGKL